MPKSTPGRILALVWMLLAMVVTASLTASLVSAAQRAGLGPVSVPDGLRDLRVTCVEGSLAARYLEQERVRCTSKPTLEAAVRAVTNGQADVAVDDALALRHANRTHASGRLRVRETRHMPQPHTFAVRAGSPLAPLLDRALLERTQDAGWAAVLERYAPTRGER